jgi:hypothetical protein
MPDAQIKQCPLTPFRLVYWLSGIVIFAYFCRYDILTHWIPFFPFWTMSKRISFSGGFWQWLPTGKGRSAGVFRRKKSFHATCHSQMHDCQSQGFRKSKIGWELTKNGFHVRSQGL